VIFYNKNALFTSPVKQYRQKERGLQAAASQTGIIRTNKKIG
jgi:hypothetical protein